MKNSARPNPTLNADPPQCAPAVQATPSRTAGLYLSIALLALTVLAIVAAWLFPMRAGDLFVALAGGRDVAAGHLGKPDDWSCLTAGRVWINQNWLSHLLIYLSWRIGGPTGVILFKAKMISLMAFFIGLLSFRRSRSLPVALLLSAGMVVSCAKFTFLRANLSTLVLMPLLIWLLHLSADRRHRIWWAVPIILLWANLHGGFIFALGMIGLWATCMTVQDWRNGGPNVLAKVWPLWACTVACIAAAAVSPFGLENLAHPFLIASSQAWKEVDEWQPLLQSQLDMPWPFFVVLGLTLVLAIARLFAGTSRPHTDTPSPQQSPGKDVNRGKRRSRSLPRTAWSFGPLAFDWLLAVMTVAMAFRSERFVPLALLAMIAPLAWLLRWSVDRFGNKIIAAGAACTLVGLVSLAGRDAVLYWPSNPLHRGSTIFQRMHYLPEMFPAQAAEFLQANQVGGDVVSEWQWEGYLRWICPQLRPLIGGRAQQVFNEHDLEVYYLLEDPRAGPEWLSRHQVNLAVLHFRSSRGRSMIFGLIDTGHWAIVYSDSDAMVLVNTQNNDALVQKALNGTLKYPSDAIGAASRMLCMATTRHWSNVSDLLAAAKRANTLLPACEVYTTLATCTRQTPLRPIVIQYLEEESMRLAQLHETPDTLLTIISSRLMIQESLSRLYHQEGKEDASAACKEKFRRIANQLAVLKDTWE